MFWKRRKKSIIISAELHEKIAQHCQPLYVPGSEIVRVKPVRDRKQKQQNRVGDPFLCFGS